MTSCPDGCTCRGSQDQSSYSSELLEALANVQAQSVRRNIIAYHTADQLTCPHCYVGPGQPCVTFPRARHATFTHQKRVRARLAQIGSRLAQISVPEA